jgi:hypothetical protein
LELEIVDDHWDLQDMTKLVPVTPGELLREEF